MQRHINPSNWWKSWCANRNNNNNPVGKYTVSIWKFGKVVGHLKKGENGKFAKAIFFFFKGDPYSKAKTITSGHRCNLHGGEGLQVPCKLKFVGH